MLPSITLAFLTSNVHMAWMRAVCGRLKSDYDYSIKIVYNNFPWPDPTEEQKARIEQTAQAILDAGPCTPIAAWPTSMTKSPCRPSCGRPTSKTTRAVMAAYGFSVKGTTESSCVAELMKLYQNKANALS